MKGHTLFHGEIIQKLFKKKFSLKNHWAKNAEISVEAFSDCEDSNHDPKDKVGFQ